MQTAAFLRWLSTAQIACPSWYPVLWFWLGPTDFLGLPRNNSLLQLFRERQQDLRRRWRHRRDHFERSPSSAICMGGVTFWWLPWISPGEHHQGSDDELRFRALGRSTRIGPWWVVWCDGTRWQQVNFLRTLPLPTLSTLFLPHFHTFIGIVGNYEKAFLFKVAMAKTIRTIRVTLMKWNNIYAHVTSALPWSHEVSGDARLMHMRAKKVMYGPK